MCLFIYLFLDITKFYDFLGSSYAMGESMILCFQECTEFEISFSMKLVESDLQDLEPVRLQNRGWGWEVL